MGGGVFGVLKQYFYGLISCYIFLLVQFMLKTYIFIIDNRAIFPLFLNVMNGKM